MGRRTYNDGTLVEEWDDTTGTYRSFGSDGGVIEERACTPEELAALAAATTQARRSQLEQTARDALTANVADISRDQQIHADALEIADSEATTLTNAQVVVVLKRLARGIALLAEHDERTKRELNALIRLTLGELDEVEA